MDTPPPPSHYSRWYTVIGTVQYFVHNRLHHFSPEAGLRAGWREVGGGGGFKDGLDISVIDTRVQPASYS